MSPAIWNWLKWDKSKEIPFLSVRYSALNIWGKNGPPFIEMCVQWISNGNIMISNLNLCIKCHVFWKWILCCMWTDCFHTLETIIHTRNLITRVHRNYANHIKPWFSKIPHPLLFRWMLSGNEVMFSVSFYFVYPELYCLVILTSYLPDSYPMLFSHGLASPDGGDWSLDKERERSKGWKFIQLAV